MSDQLPADDRDENSVTVRYWAAARAAAGVATDQVRPGTLADVLAEISRRHRSSTRFDDVIESCSILVDEVPSTTTDRREVVVDAGAVVDLLPPFAGGAA